MTIKRFAAWLSVGILPLVGACTAELVANLTAERTGQVSVTFVNTTDVRAVFSFGLFDSLDRNPPGQIAFRQLRLEANDTSEPQDITCRRNFQIGLAELLQRGLEADVDTGANFDPDAFVAQVNFSDAPEDSDLAGLPTAGFAEGIEFLLGVDFQCDDQLIVAFSRDATAPGGFRIDLDVIAAVDEP